jgi:hypothetical protein
MLRVLVCHSLSRISCLVILFVYLSFLSSCREREKLKSFLQFDLYKVLKNCAQSTMSKHVVTVVEGKFLASRWSKVAEASISSEKENLKVYIDHKRSNSDLIYYYYYKNKFGKEKHYEFFDRRLVGSDPHIAFDFFFYLEHFKDRQDLVMNFLDGKGNTLRTFQVNTDRSHKSSNSLDNVNFLYRLDKDYLQLKKSSSMDGDLEYRTGSKHRIVPIFFKAKETYKFPIPKDIGYLAVLSFDEATKTELKVVLIDKFGGCRSVPRWTKAL